jgi:multidrug efflux system membrane fusion protein
VTVARDAGGETVIAQGVAPGETVVTEGHLRLSPGASVEIRQAGAEQPGGEAPAASPATGR